MYVLSSKIENAHWAEKMTTTRCGITERATTRNFVLWLFLNNRNALWHVKICHDAKVVSWLLNEMTTIAEFMKIPQGVVVVAFYRYNGRDKEDKEEAIQQDRKDEDENQTNDTSEETV